MGVVVIGIGLAGCAASQREFEVSEANDVESTLRSAGFRLIPSDTPERIESMRSLPPLAFSRVAREGRDYFVYADPRSCRCIWVGTPRQMEHFARLAREREMGELGEEIGDVELEVGLWDPDWSSIDF